MTVVNHPPTLSANVATVADFDALHLPERPNTAG